MINADWGNYTTSILPQTYVASHIPVYDAKQNFELFDFDGMLFPISPAGIYKYDDSRFVSVEFIT